MLNAFLGDGVVEQVEASFSAHQQILEITVPRIFLEIVVGEGFDTILPVSSFEKDLHIFFEDAALVVGQSVIKSVLEHLLELDYVIAKRLSYYSQGFASYLLFVGLSARQFLFGGSFSTANGRQLFQYALTESHKVTSQDLIKSGAICGVCLEDAHDQSDCFIGNSHSLGDYIVAFSDLLISRIGIFSFEGRYTKVEGVEDNSQAPDVDLKVVSLAVENFRSDVIGCSTDCAFALFLKFQFGGQSEVSDFYIEFPVDEDVAEFQVAMDDPLRMNVLDSVDDAVHEGLDFGGDEVGADVDEFVEGLVGAELQENVDVVFVFEAVLEFNYVWVMQRFVQTDLVGQSQAGSVCFKVLFYDYLGC